MHELECDYLATGHYALLQHREGQIPHVFTSTDSWKDQTYFLFTLPSTILPRLMFPIGHLTKPEVRKLAEEKGLLIASKKDSTGICFIGPGGYAKFMEDHVAKDLLRPGRLRMFPSGEILGEHQGIHHFTRGQRKGLGVYHEKPLYVIRVDVANHEVWLGEEEHLYAKTFEVKDAHFIDPLVSGERLRVKIRYAHQGAFATVHKEGEQWRVECEEPQRAITPGQAAVFYRDRQLLGGGWIC
jgi:tRNA-specific 2-thiouridylase